MNVETMPQCDHCKAEPGFYLCLSKACPNFNMYYCMGCSTPEKKLHTHEINMTKNIA